MKVLRDSISLCKISHKFNFIECPNGVELKNIQKAKGCHKCIPQYSPHLVKEETRKF